MNPGFTPYSAALDAYAVGISVWPPTQDGSKAPAGAWKKGQYEQAGEAQIEAWYSHGLTGVGWVCGAVSGGLEVLDFDDRAAWTEYQRQAREAGLGELLDRVVAGYLEYSPNGAHLAYRCKTIAGNTKLAKRQLADGRWKSVIETRGEGGYIIVAPSHGAVNASGAYEMRSGGCETIQTIEPWERDALWSVARAFDESIVPVDDRLPASRGREGERPGDAYNAQVSWDDVLAHHGWRKLFTSGGVTRWCRPGKDHGVSATTGYAGTDLLYVFSTSTQFEANRGYSKFSAYGLLEHGGDFGEAARALALRGYAGQLLEIPERAGIDFTEFRRNVFGIGSVVAPAVSAPSGPPPLSALMKVPGAIGELAEWIDAGATLRQPVLALGASLAFFSMLLGRKVRTSSNLRSNLYVLSTAKSGRGKERARSAMKQLASMLGLVGVVGERPASGSAIEKAVVRRPVRLFLMDEFGRFLGTMNDRTSDSYLRDIVPVLLSVYTASDSYFQPRETASEEPEGVEQPSLSIYGTTVPSDLYPNLTKDLFSNGLLGRCLVFDAEDEVPPLQEVTMLDPPSGLVGVCRHWASAPINVDPNAGDIERLKIPAPLIVPTTVGAMRVINSADEIFRAKTRSTQDDGEQALFSRLRATAWKLALIRACGIDPSPQITEQDAEWGKGLAWRLIEDLATRAGGGAPENKVEDASQRVLAMICKAGADGIGHSDLVSSTRWLSSRDRNDTIGALLEAGKATKETLQSTGGRRKTVYKAVV